MYYFRVDLIHVVDGDLDLVVFVADAATEAYLNSESKDKNLCRKLFDRMSSI